MVPSARSRTRSRGGFFGPLAAIALGLSAGALLTEGGLLAPWWRAENPQTFLAWYAANTGRLFGFFAPLEVGGSLVAIAAAFSHRRRPGRWWFVFAALLSVGVLALFPLYFDQANRSFADGSVGVERLSEELARWAAWNWGRTAIAIAAFASAVLGVRASAAG
jgi:uncharacterized membrane protein